MVNISKALYLHENILIKNFNEVEGVFSGVLVKYGNRDRQGDIILNNACVKSAQEWNDGRQIPAYFEHLPSKIIANNLGSVWNYSTGVEISMRASDAFKKDFPKEYQSMIEAYNDGSAYFSVGITASKSVYQEINKTDSNGVFTRYIFNEVYIAEGSFTTSPANPQARVDFMKNQKEDFETILKNITSFSRAEEFLRKNTDFTQSQCTEFLRAFQNAIEKRNSSPAQDCPTNEPAQVQNNNASFWGEVDQLLTKK